MTAHDNTEKNVLESLFKGPLRHNFVCQRKYETKSIIKTEVKVQDLKT